MAESAWGDTDVAAAEPVEWWRFYGDRGPQDPEDNALVHPCCGGPYHEGVWGHYYDCVNSQSSRRPTRVRAVMDGNDATRLPYNGRVCDCPHGTGSQQCCIQQLGLQ